MRLVTVSARGGTPRVGVMRGEDSVVDVGETARALGSNLPFDAGDMVSLIAAGPAGLRAAGDMYFKIPRIIAEHSAGLTLEPGDLIATGTPAGVGHARTPPEFMKAGDVLETGIVELGLLRNRIGA